MDDRIQLVRQMPVFGGLNDQSLKFLLDHSETVEIAQIDSFFQEGDAATAFFVLESGNVVVEKEWQGVPVQIRQLGPGDCFGEMAIIDLEPRSASVRAVTDCRAIKISRKILYDLFREDLEQYAIIMMNMGREVSRRLRRVSERLFELDQTFSS